MGKYQIMWIVRMIVGMDFEIKNITLKITILDEIIVNAD